MKKNLLQYVNAQDLKTFGLIPELLGRLPVVTYLNPLDAETLRQILGGYPKYPRLKQYKKLFELKALSCISMMPYMISWSAKPWNTNSAPWFDPASAKAF